MKLLGATVRVVESGTQTLKDAMNEALRDWIATVRDTFYVIGSVAGPHPYPLMVRDFQSVIGVEARRQMLEASPAACPTCCVACVGGGSNAMGLFQPFLGDDVASSWSASRPPGDGLESGRHAATLARGQVGVLHGKKTYLLQDEVGQIRGTHSISAGLDYPGVGPEHSYLRDIGPRGIRLGHGRRGDRGAEDCSPSTEGIIPALESAHAIAHGDAVGADAREGPRDPRQSLRARRQGHEHDRGTISGFTR